MLLCFVCLSEDRESTSKAVTYVQGTAVCREHVVAVGRGDLMSLSYKLNELARRFKEGTSNAGNGKVAAKSSHDADS